MAYASDKKPGELTALTSLATDDVFVVGDTSDASEVAKYITKANLITDLGSSFAATLGADDNYVTDAEKTKLANLSGTNTGDQDLSTLAPKASPTFTGTVTLPVALTGVIRADTGVVSVDTDVTDIVAAGTDTAAGKLELATDAETVTGTDTARATTPANITAKMSAPGAIGNTTPSTGKFTTVETTGGIELGHASDTTITRVSAGLIAVEGSNIIRASDVDDTPVNGETAVPVSSNWAFDHAALASSDTVVGHVEIATTAETNTGTDATRAVSPDGLSGSYAGTKSVSVQVFEGATDVTTGDGKAYITIPEALNGMNLVRAQATVATAGTTNATTVMIHNKTDAQDMLSGAISIASGGTVGTVGTINTTYDDVATNDILRIDVDSVSTTAPKGLMVVLEFRLP